jgi:hypothetical protein
MATVAPCLVRLPRLSVGPHKVERFGGWFIPQDLALKVGGYGENFQTVPFGEINPFLRVGGGACIGIAATKVEFPRRFFPTVEATFLQKTNPLIERHVAKLATDQSDLVKRTFAIAMLLGLVEAHRKSSVNLAMKR